MPHSPAPSVDRQPQRPSTRRSKPKAYRLISKRTSKHSTLQKRMASVATATRAATLLAPETQPPRAKRASQSPATKLWLDELPLELCAQIAHHVNTQEKAHLLCLAEVSAKQRRAVLQFLSHDFSFPTRNTARWASLFGADVHKVNVVGWDGRENDALTLLKAPQLQGARISSLPAHLEVLAIAPELRELHIVYTHPVSVDTFVSALSRLNLTVLRLTWLKPITSINHSMFAIRFGHRIGLNLCPNLSSLELTCLCNEDTAGCDISAILQRFPKLRKFKGNIPVSNRTVPILRTLESVELQDLHSSVGMDTQLSQATQIGGSVTSLEALADFSVSYNSYKPVRAGGVAQLVNCPNLSKLRLLLAPHAERSLPQLRDLRVLDLRWQVSISYPGPVGHYYTPPPDFVFQITDTAPKVNELRLFQVELSLNDVAALLGAYGSRLEVFGASICGQPEAPRERVVALMAAASACNPLLRRLEIRHGPCYHPLADESIQGVESWMLRFYRALAVLRRRVPRFDIERLCADLGFLLKGPPASSRARG